jgi:site-specific recombinase XerD
MAEHGAQLIVLTPAAGVPLPAVIASAGQRAARRFVEFFTANIQNSNTRAAYARAINAFLSWCENEADTAFDMVEPVVVAAYVEKLLKKDGLSKPTVKQHLAAIRMLFDWMVTGGILAVNPASAVRGPKYVIKKGKTPVLTPAEARLLLDSIPLVRSTRRRGREPQEQPCLAGFRDRALLAVMVYTFARASAAVGMNVEDYYQQGKRWWVRLHEKGGKHHELPVHHKAEEYLDAYLKISGIGAEKNTPLSLARASRRNQIIRHMIRPSASNLLTPMCFLRPLSCYEYQWVRLPSLAQRRRARPHSAHTGQRCAQLADAPINGSKSATSGGDNGASE